MSKFFDEEPRPLIEKNGIWYEEGTDIPYSDVRESTGLYEGNPAVFIGEYKEGKEHGVWRIYDEEDNLILTLEFKNGLLEGPTQRYYPSGQLMVLGLYKNDKAESNWLYFDKNGKIEQRVRYKEDELVH